MNVSYERDIDLNLLRVFVVVVETGSVTEAAGRLYLTQSAVSAALKRLTRATGKQLFAPKGRRIAPTAYGKRLYETARPHLLALIEAMQSPEKFEPLTSTRTIRLGLSDTAESWLLPKLLAILSTLAPKIRIITIPVQFRSVGELLSSSQVDMAITVADELSSSIQRRPLFTGDFVCLFDPRYCNLPPCPTLEQYLTEQHVIVSYNGDLRGVVEDILHVQRDVKVSVPSFHSIGAIVDGSALVATVPTLVANEIRSIRPHLQRAPIPVEIESSSVELLWQSATNDDQALVFLRDQIVHISQQLAVD